jgi:FlaA1/EpsC-like NDP-sugar epimerase
LVHDTPTTSPASSADDLAILATGRSSGLFESDLRSYASQIQDRFRGARVLVLGGAGSIGSSTVGLLSELDISCLHVVDQNENALAELVRDLRSRPSGLRVEDFRTLPIDMGSPIMRRFIAAERPYDWVLNFAAIKHVRSEKDVTSILQMFDTNLLKPIQCWQWILEKGPAPAYFSVSTDKAAEPVNLMGASKRLMEHIMFCAGGPMDAAKRSTTSRFANVAFSNGSLLESFVRRFEKRQPLAAPRETKRFFISLREAGQICLLAAGCGPDRHIVVPRLDPHADTRRLDEIAVAFLRRQGLEPKCYENEAVARNSVSRDLADGRYPLLLTNLDTQGEKTCEKFSAEDEEVSEFGMRSALAVRYRPVSVDLLNQLVRDVNALVYSANRVVDKKQIVQAVAGVLPEFRHVDSSEILDRRM